MKKPINPKINRAQLKKLDIELNKAGRIICECSQAVEDKIYEQLRFEGALRDYKKTMAHEKMTRTVFKMRQSGSTFTEIGKKIGKNRREVGAIYREGEPAIAKTRSQ